MQLGNRSNNNNDKKTIETLAVVDSERLRDR